MVLHKNFKNQNLMYLFIFKKKIHPVEWITLYTSIGTKKKHDIGTSNKVTLPSAILNIYIM